MSHNTVCLGTSSLWVAAAEKANSALVSGSGCAKENTWAVCVGRILPYPLSLPLSAFADQQLSLIFPVTCWDFSLSLHFRVVFSSYGIVLYKASETGCPIHLCVHIASAGSLHIFIPGISSSDTCCLALLTSPHNVAAKIISLLIWNRLFPFLSCHSFSLKQESLVFIVKAFFHVSHIFCLLLKCLLKSLIGCDALMNWRWPQTKFWCLESSFDFQI